MKILNLQGENFKRMRAFDITPKDNTVVIAGKNGQGKTSVLDAIVMALAGKSSEVAKLTTKPIRAGETHASVTVTTDEYIITRTWTEKDSYLEMTNKEGMIFKSPQALLDQIVGDLCFDPLEFSRMKPKDQREALLGIVKLPIDLDQWEKDYKLKYDERTSIGAQGKAIQGKLDTLPEVPQGTPDTEVSVQALVTELQVAEAHNREFEDCSKTLAETKAMITELENKLALEKTKLPLLEQGLAAIGAPTDVTVIKNRMAGAEEVNKAVRIKKERVQAMEDVVKYDEAYAAKTISLANMQDEKAAALAGAQFPIAGLSFSDDGVTFIQKVGDATEPIPFAQLSSAQQLKVSMAIAMAKNPRLRVIRITDGSLLDEDNMKVLHEMADKNDFQIWVEKVDSSGKVGIVIADGEVVSENAA